MSPEHGRAGRWQTSAYAALVAAHVVFVWAVPFFASQDGPAHVAEIVIMHELAAGTGGRADWYELEPKLLPNLGFRALAYPLAWILPARAVERMFLTIHVLLLAIAAPLLLRAFDRTVYPAAWFVFPLIFSFCLVQGFFSYCISVALAVLAISALWRVRDRRPLARALVINAAAVVLFFGHLIAFGVFMCALALRPLTQDARLRERLTRAGTDVALAAPSLLLAVWYILGHRYAPEAIAWRRPWAALADLVTFGAVTMSPWQFVPCGLSGVLLVAAAACGARRLERGALRFLAGLGALLLLICICAPTGFIGGGHFTMRLVPPLVLIALPFVETPLLLRRGFAAAAALLAVVHFAMTATLLAEQSRIVAEFTAADLPRGAAFLTVRSDLRRPGFFPRFDPLLHAGDYYGMRGATHLGYYDARLAHYYPIRFRREIPARPDFIQAYKDPASVDWSRWPGVQYLLGWSITSEDAHHISEDFERIWTRSDSRLTVWRRRP